VPSRRRRSRKRWTLPVRPAVLFSGLGIVLAVGLAYVLAGLEGGLPGNASTAADLSLTAGEPATDMGSGTYQDIMDAEADDRVSVTLLSSAEFDATQVAPETVRLGGAEVSTRIDDGGYRTRQVDKDGDGWLDLVVEIESEDLSADDIRNGSAELTGSTYDGQPFRGEGRLDLPGSGP